MKEFYQTVYSLNIKPTVLKNKDKCLIDLGNIEWSLSGRVDIFTIGNFFIRESVQMLANSIKLFEMGYFDCAYFSLRSSIELSTVFVFLSDMPDEERNKYTDVWKKELNDFPMHGKMLSDLIKKGDIFADMQNKMADFFNSAKTINDRINKYVHKQGFCHFYTSNILKVNDSFIEDFESYLKKCIGIVAVMRLAIDPFPVLLMDEEIVFRSNEMFTEPYGQDFVSEYIGNDVISAYKTTQVYTNAYDFFIKKEKQSQPIFDIIHHSYVDVGQFNEIFKQLHLLAYEDVVCLMFIYVCEKAIKVHYHDILGTYFTNRQSKRKSMSVSSLDFSIFRNDEDRYNQTYDEVFISTFVFDGHYILIEHNEILDSNDILVIENNINEILPIAKKWLGYSDTY